MSAVAHLFRDRRFHEVTLDDVARAARVGKGTIYRFFSDKEDLFFQTATAGFDDLCAILDRPAPAHAEFRDRLLYACTQITRFFDARRHLIRMMASEEGRALAGEGKLKSRWLKRRGKMVAALAGMLQDGIEHGAIRADLSGDVLAVYLLSLLRTRAHELHGVSGDRDSLEHLLDIFWRGIGNGEAV